jgi:hypothetical protein
MKKYFSVLGLLIIASMVLAVHSISHQVSDEPIRTYTSDLPPAPTGGSHPPI